MQNNPKVIFVKRYYREDIKDSPDKVYVFGDNYARAGYGGQANACRGLPNTVGIRTKYYPSNTPESFFGRNTSLEKVMISQDIAYIKQALNNGFTVVMPEDGIGTGLADLKNKAPSVAEHLNQELTLLGILFKESNNYE